MSRRTLGLLLLLVGLGIGAHAELAQAGSTVFGLFRVLINGTEQASITGLNLPAGSTCDGSVCTIAGGGGGSAPTGCQRGYVLVAADDGGTSTCVATVSVDPATGNITLANGATIDGLDPSAAVTQLAALGSSAISSVCYLDGGLNDGATCAQQQSQLRVSPSQIAWNNEDGGTGLRLNTPTVNDRPIGVTDYRAARATAFADECSEVRVTTTGATLTVFYRYAIPAATSGTVEGTCRATSMGGGGAVVTAHYEFVYGAKVADGGSTPTNSGSGLNVYSIREDDSTWGGPAGATFDGGGGVGVVELALQGAAGQTIDWNCSVCVTYQPRRDAGF